MLMIPQQVIDTAYSYPEYLQLIEALLSDGKTTGSIQNEEMTGYTQLNLRRMNRLNKTTRLNPEVEEIIKGIQRPQIWLVISEAWCGDAAQVLPVIYKMAEANERVSLKIILRDEHPEVIDQYLTNGGRSIPKVIAMDAEDLAVTGVWGPRPELLQQQVLDGKKQGIPKEKVNLDTQRWYTQDKTRSIQNEFVSLFESKLIKN